MKKIFTKKLKRRLATIVIAALLAFLAYLTFSRIFSGFDEERPQTLTVFVEDVTNKSSITLTSPSQKVSGLSLYVTGNIDGRAYISVLDWRKEELSGKVNKLISCDGRMTTCVVQYEPISVTSGNLRIDYTFH